METIITLKEYLETIIANAKESNDKAILIASVELARRLEILNGEASRLAKMQETYYPREVAEQKMEQLDKSIRELQLSKALLDGKANQKQVSIALILGIISLLLSALSIALRILIK